jgi:hypothetical protein
MVRKLSRLKELAPVVKKLQLCRQQGGRELW